MYTSKDFEVGSIYKYLHMGSASGYISIITEVNRMSVSIRRNDTLRMGCHTNTTLDMPIEKNKIMILKR